MDQAKKSKKKTSKVSSKSETDNTKNEKSFFSKIPNYVWLVLLTVIVLGIMAYIATIEKTGIDEDLTYRDIQFAKDNCPGIERECYYAYLSINGEEYVMPFEHHPTEVEDILFEYPVLDYIRVVYQSGNATAIIGVPDGAPSTVGVAGAQLGRVLGDRYNLLNMRVVARTIGTGEDQVDCRYATNQQFVILFEQGTPDGVFVKVPGCAAVRAQEPEDLSLVVDAFVYRILGIIPTTRPIPTAQ